MDHHLDALPDLYAALGDALEPGAVGGQRVSSSRTAPLPVRLEPLALRERGGMVTILTSWTQDWAQQRHLKIQRPAPTTVCRWPRELDRHDMPGRTERDLRAACQFLRRHLAWACEHHPAIGAFATELREVSTACRRVIDGPPEDRTIGRCPTDIGGGETCGTQLRAEPAAQEITCPRCHVSWPRARWLNLGQRIQSLTQETAMQPDPSSRPDVIQRAAATLITLDELGQFYRRARAARAPGGAPIRATLTLAGGLRTISITPEPPQLPVFQSYPLDAGHDPDDLRGWVEGRGWHISPWHRRLRGRTQLWEIRGPDDAPVLLAPVEHTLLWDVAEQTMGMRIPAGVELWPIGTERTR